MLCLTPQRGRWTWKEQLSSQLSSGARTEARQACTLWWLRLILIISTKTLQLAVAPLAQEGDMRWNPNDDGIDFNP